MLQRLYLNCRQSSVFKIVTPGQKKALSAFYKILTWQQRLAIANYLNSVIYSYPEHNPPKSNRGICSAQSMDLELE